MLTYISGEGMRRISNCFLFTGFLLLKDGSAHIVDVCLQFITMLLIYGLW